MAQVAKVAIAATALACLFALIFVIYLYTGNKESQTFVKEGVKIERIKIPKNCGFIAGNGDRMSVQCKWEDAAEERRGGRGFRIAAHCGSFVDNAKPIGFMLFVVLF